MGQQAVVNFGNLRRCSGDKANGKQRVKQEAGSNRLYGYRRVYGDDATGRKGRNGRCPKTSRGDSTVRADAWRHDSAVLW